MYNACIYIGTIADGWMSINMNETDISMYIWVKDNILPNSNDEFESLIS